MYVAISVFAALVLFYIVVAYMASKSWYVAHVLLLVGVFLLSAVFMVLAAMTLATHQAWRNIYNRLQSELATTTAKVDSLRSGGPTNELESVPAVQAELGRYLIDRGRVWRGAELVNVADNAYSLNLANWGDAKCARVGVESAELLPQPGVEPGAEGGAPGVVPHSIQEGMALYAFLETSLAQLSDAQRAALFGDATLPSLDVEGVCRLPIRYLGHFRVTGVNDQTITVAPIEPLRWDQTPEGSWTLYEVMPVDRHDLYVGLPNEQLSTLFRAPGGDDASQILGEALAHYARDQQPAQQTDAPERTATKVRFVRDHAIDVDVEPSEEDTVERAFDRRGRGMAPQLRQGSPTEFKADDVATFDSVTADRLVKSGVCVLVEGSAIYVRPLRDYGYLVQHLHDALHDVALQAAAEQATNKTISEAVALAQQEIAATQKVRQWLGEDLRNYETELSIVRDLRERLASQRTQQRETLSKLYRLNNKLHQRLVRQQTSPQASRTASHVASPGKLVGSP
jgi:hypothetical protein